MARLTIDVPDKTERTLNDLADKEHLQLGELLQRAVALYRFAQERTADGHLKLSLTAPDGKVIANITVGDE